jgi:molybdopterin synthase sulfur carrier subunit
LTSYATSQAAIDSSATPGSTDDGTANTPSGNSRKPTPATLLLFAGARVAAGVAKEEVWAATVGELLEGARARYGEEFARVLASSSIWVNGEPASESDALAEGDEIAVLPPVSGGCAGS